MESGCRENPDNFSKVDVRTPEYVRPPLDLTVSEPGPSVAVLTKNQFESIMKEFQDYYSSREKSVHAEYQSSKRPERNKRKAERRKSRARVKI